MQIDIQKIIVSNILSALNNKFKSNDNKMKTYISYLNSKTNISCNRIKNILLQEKKVRISIIELIKISNALDIDIGSLFLKY